MKSLLIISLIITSFQSFSQDLKYWKEGNSYTYSAIYLNEKGDTLSNEEIKVIVTDTMFNGDQTLLRYYFHPVNSDLKSRTDSMLGRDNEWLKSIGEGAKENDQLWIHPFRSNQYVVTEICPFPHVLFPPTSGLSWESLLVIQKGWGDFKGRVKNTYKIISNSTRQYAMGELENCWEIQSVGKHRKKGKNYLTTYFKDDFGFLEMNYVLYNGDQIKFKMIALEKS